MSDDRYYMDTETEQKQNSVQSKACSCMQKFLLAIIAIGLLALFVFQLIIMASCTETKASNGIEDVTIEVSDPVVV